MKLWDLPSPVLTCLLPAASQEKQETALQHSSLHAYKLQNMSLPGFTKIIFQWFSSSSLALTGSGVDIDWRGSNPWLSKKNWRPVIRLFIKTSNPAGGLTYLLWLKDTVKIYITDTLRIIGRWQSTVYLQHGSTDQCLGLLNTYIIFTIIKKKKVAKQQL